MKTVRALMVGAAALAVVSCASLALARGDGGPATLVDEVRRATDAFHDVMTATSVGYAPFLGCVSAPKGGAMGIHFVKGDLVGDGQIDASHAGSPNRYGLPAFYALHVWAWRKNPAGVFEDWNPTVSCEEATAQSGTAHGSH